MSKDYPRNYKFNAAYWLFLSLLEVKWYWAYMPVVLVPVQTTVTSMKVFE